MSDHIHPAFQPTEKFLDWLDELCEASSASRRKREQKREEVEKAERAKAAALAQRKREVEQASEKRTVAGGQRKSLKRRAEEAVGRVYMMEDFDRRPELVKQQEQEDERTKSTKHKRASVVGGSGTSRA